MAEIRTKSEQREYLSRLIADWNASRLDIFAISEPTEDLEYRGVMRFFFQDSGSKVATKCVRFTNRDNTEEVTKVLVEKFHPDMKMLSNPTYSLYEVHPNGDARKLRMNEYPLQIQLEWQLDDREGRFLLKSDSDKIVHSNLFDVKSSDKTVPQATAGQNLKRRLSKREKKQLKKQREEAKKAAEKAGKDDNQIAQHLYDELPETSFTRSISNPEAVMRRRRQQKLEKRLKDFQNKDSPAGGTLKIFATTLKPEIPYKTLLVSVDDTTTHVIKEALIKYQMEKEDPEEYCLVMVNIPADGTNTSATLGKERVVHDDDCPLKIAVTWPSNRGTVVFHLRRRANLPQHRRDKRRSKSPVRKPMDLTPDKTVGERLAKPAYPDHLLPYLLELSSDGNDLDYKPRIHRLQMNATEVGSEKTFASGGNYLQLHAPHILPRHCVITNMDGRVSVTPSSGDAEVLVNGKRIYETTQLQHGDVVKIGRLHTFRFCDPAYEKPQRHSAPAAGETGSISSNSDIDVQRKPRPQSLGSALPSHHSNSYPSNNIDDHVDIDTNAHPDGMFETTFDVSGEVLTYTGGHRETEPYTYSRPPDSPTKTSFNNADDMYDDKLPATLEFRENGEDAFFAAVISEVNGLAVHFKLAPTYTLYMCSRYRLSPHYRADLMEHQRGERLGVTILKIANMARSTIRENAEMPGSLAFWMANCSEFLHFIKEDMDISPYTKDGQQVLAQSVQLAFRHLVLCVQHELRTSMSAFLDPTDEADMEESDLDSMNDSDNDHMGMPSDGRSFRVQNKYGQDGRPLSGADSWLGGRRLHGRATVSEVIYNLTSTMSLLRRCRVNAALTIQVFSQLFHFINMWLFNKLILEPKLDLCTREWGRRISKRLARVEKWAEKQGLELAADCHLCRIAQAAHLLQAPKNSSADINAISSSCFKLNSLQMRTLLENYRPAPDEYLSQEHIERLVATAEEKADEVARSNGQEIQREEETELQLPFLLPEDGYSCDVIRGVPPGLQGFLEPLANTGLCRLTIQPETSGLWTVYQRKHMEASVDVPATITPDVQEVSFNKGRGGMGLSIVAAKGIRQDKLGIYIKQVVKDGPASKDGRLQAGDQILSVNGESLVGVTQEKAAEVMTKSGSIVTLKIVKQGAIYHGLATMLIQQSPNRETAPPAPRRLTPVEPEPEPMQLSPTLPENDIPSPGRWLADSTRQREDEESMREDSWRQKEEEIRRGKEEEDRMFEERMRQEDEERRREDEERRRREEENRIRLEEEDRIREEEEERMRLEEEERRRREEEDRLYEERLRKEEEEKRLYEERRRKEEEDKRALRIRQEKQEEERRRREAEEDEKFRIQEERIRKRMEEERRVIEEERRKLAEERRLLEEERKKEAERKRTEEQRLVEEERRLAEEKQMIEEERRRVLNQKKAEDETRRLEEERMALIAQRRRVEEEREVAEEQRREEMEEEERREEMEEMRRREEIRKREEFRRMEDLRRLAEERKRSEEEERLRGPIENKQRTRRIRFEDEVMAENAPKVETVQQTRSSPPPVEAKPEKEIIKPTLKASVEAEKPEIAAINKKPRDEYYEEEPVVVRGKLTDEDMSTMDALFEKLDEDQHVRPSSLNINRPVNKQPFAEEPPTSPIRVDSRDTRFGRAIVIKQGMLPSARSSSQNKTSFDYESVAQNLKAIDQSRRHKQDVSNDDEFERWQKRQREIAEQREREAEERARLGREQEEMRQREQRDREQREREQREREQRERQQREREQREREQREREKREREQREREQREREEREREQREREQREREQREREQREREQREREQREREQRELEQRERERQEQEHREELERQRLEKERLERERKEYLDRKRKEQEEREKAEAEKQRSVEDKKKQEEAEERRRLVERERKMLHSTSKGSRETLDYIEAMDADEVEREFQRRLEAEKKRRSLDRSYEDRRAGGLVSVTRVTYHPDRDDQSERDRKLQMIIQERKELEREKKESERRVVFEGEREKQRELLRRQQEENERQQEDWLRQQREKHEQARREQGRLRMDKKSQENEDIMKKRNELQQRREQEDSVRMNIQRVREEEERKMNEEHKQQRLEQERDLQRKLEEQKILIEKESEARRQLQDEQRTRSARGSTGEPDHVIELKERALKDYERRRMLIDQEINRQRAEGRFQEQLRQTAMEDMKTKFDQQPKPVSVLKTSNGNKPKKQVSFSNMSTEFHEPSSPTYVVESSSGYTAKITPTASVRLVQTRPPADPDSPPIPRPPPPDDDDYDDYDPPPLPPPPPPEELFDIDHFPPPPRTLFNDRSSSSSSMSSSDPRSPVDYNSRDYSDVFPADYPYPPNSHQFKNTVSSYGTYPRGTRPVSYPTPADLDNLQFNDSIRYGGSNNNISGFNSSSGIRETQSLGRITSTDASAVEANRIRMGRISLTDDTRKEPPPVAKKPEVLGFKEKMKMFNQDGTPKSRVTVSRWEREQMNVNGDVSYT